MLNRKKTKRKLCQYAHGKEIYCSLLNENMISNRSVNCLLLNKSVNSCPFKDGIESICPVTNGRHTPILTQEEYEFVCSSCGEVLERNYALDFEKDISSINIETSKYRQKKSVAYLEIERKIKKYNKRINKLKNLPIDHQNIYEGIISTLEYEKIFSDLELNLISSNLLKNLKTIKSQKKTSIY